MGGSGIKAFSRKCDMRRKDKAIVELAEIEQILRRALVCRLGLTDGNRPYIVPLSFGFKNNTLYFHSAPEGMKIEMLRKNSKVCFEFDVDHEVVADEEACKWGMKYRSVIGFGKASIVEDNREKQEGLNAILEHYSGRTYDCPEAAVNSTLVIKVEIESMTGKQSGY
jgi:nitroimidazol reductase NimA-like FMN-containing flavoprotein (pyridoxamine 5'-phosphate oxidase superfamily)